MSTATNAPLPDREPMLPHPAKVVKIYNEAYGVSTFVLKFQEERYAAAYRFQPGQFNMLYVPGCGEAAISISSDPETPGEVGHTIRYAGMVTRAISRLKVGDLVAVRGPYGTPWPMDSVAGKNLLVVTGGIGMAPMRPVILQLLNHRERFGRVVLLYGGRTPQDLLFTNEWDQWKGRGLEVHVSVDTADDTWHGEVGVIPMDFYRVRMDWKNTVVLTCGPEIMMRFVIYESLARRIPKDRIFISMERNMKCAVGLCGHCQIGPKFACKHGPVFSYAAVEQFFGKEEF